MQEELKIEKLNIAEIKPYSKNAKRHPKKQIEQIKKSIEDFGFNDPIERMAWKKIKDVLQVLKILLLIVNIVIIINLRKVF